MNGYMATAISSASDEWPTSRSDFEKLNREFGPLELDVCATPENAKCPQYFTKADDGLAQAWHGRCWMNPRYGRGIERWMRKADLSAAEGSPGRRLGAGPCRYVLVAPERR